MAIRKNTRKKRKTAVKFLNEFSKVMLCISGIIGIGTVAMYYYCILLGYEPDPSVAVAGITEIIVPFIGYCAYQLGMKCSLNKNNLKIGTDNTVCRIGEEDSNETPTD